MQPVPCHLVGALLLWNAIRKWVFGLAALPYWFSNCCKGGCMPFSVPRELHGTCVQGHDCGGTRPPIVWEQEHCPNMCNDRGTCRRGWCHCQPGFFGIDCSRTRVRRCSAGSQKASRCCVCLGHCFCLCRGRMLTSPPSASRRRVELRSRGRDGVSVPVIFWQSSSGHHASCFCRPSSVRRSG